ncbi:MAG: LEPBI_I0682 family protein [Leptospira bouyouniensis]
MKKIIVVLLSVTFIMMNCKTSTSTGYMAGVANLPLAAAAYDVGQETSAKACNYELGFFHLNYEGLDSGHTPTLSTLEWIAAIGTYSIYYWYKVAPEYSVKAAAIHRALKKTDGDVLFEMKTTTQTDGFFFPDVCVTVSGKSANLTGPSVTAKK